MIRLHKSIIPVVLTRNASRWLAELKTAIQGGNKKEINSKKSRYNHPDIKTAVSNETYGKCAYCEADVEAVSHGDIEHIYPKSLDIEKTFQWENLGFACQKCNQNKSNKDPFLEHIIDPYNIDPAPFLCFYGPFINSRATTEGRLTIFNLGLDRTALTERRQQAFLGLVKSMEIINTARTEAERTALINDFERNELNVKLEFLAMRRDFWSAYRQSVQGGR